MPRKLLAAALCAALALACRGGALTPQEAASALRAAPEFTERPGSPVGRELIEVSVVRRLGRASAEVEFTWRDRPGPAAAPSGPLRSSMALFRKLDNGTWALSSLYKVN